MNYKKTAALISLAGAGILTGVRTKDYKEQIKALKDKNDKLSDNYLLLNHWLEIRNEERSAAEYFRDMGYKHIAVYGMAELANRLAEELENSDIQIDYGIDRDVSCTNSRIENVYSLQDELPVTDVVVVMPYYAFDGICRDLKKKVKCPIVSIEDVIWSV